MYDDIYWNMHKHSLENKINIMMPVGEELSGQMWEEDLL